MVLGDIILAYRKKYQLSQREFAKLCNISYTYVSALEKNFDYRTNKPISPTLDTIKKVASAINTPIENILKMLDDTQPITLNATLINVYSSVHAGIPNEMIDNIVDTEEISEDMLKGNKEYFGVKVKGDSMFPEYLENDTIICEKTNDCENGDDCIVSINGNEAFLKRVYKNTNGITLQALNSKYEPLSYTNEEVISIPITIIGIVRELRRKK